MAKKVASAVPIHKGKLKKRGKRKKFLLRTVFDYLRSDTYMFAPLVSSKSSDFCSTATFSVSSSGLVATEPNWEKENLIEKVKDYTVSDQYLYAPLVANRPLSHAAIGASSSHDKGPTLDSRETDTSNWQESRKKLTGETTDPRQKRISVGIEELRLGSYPCGGTTIIRHIQLKKETVKHVVQQKCHS